MENPRMSLYQIFPNVVRGLFLTGLLLSLGGCDWLKAQIGMSGGDTAAEEEAPARELKFAIAKGTSTLPWLVAADEGVFQRYNEEFGVGVNFSTGDYDAIINQFISGDVDATIINNIDAFSKLVNRGVESDVILICSYSEGNDVVLLREDVNEIAGQAIALKQYSRSQYLLERYLLKNLIDFDQVTVVNTPEAEILGALDKSGVAGVATWNPYADVLRKDKQAKPLFDSRSIPHELVDVLVVRRQTLNEFPVFGQALLATWFTVMERLQGNRRGATLDAMSNVAGVSREEFDKQFSDILLTDTAPKALSTIRDRRMKKTMRHIRYFIERHKLAGTAPVSNWVSYPGRTEALLHFNAEPLERFVAPPEAEAP
jgi:NitT/TauT family transport system substrate-binding protein